MDGTIYDIYVYDDNSLDSSVEITEDDILNYEIENVMGVMVPVRDVISNPDDLIVDGLTVINRVNGARTITVSADYKEGVNVTDVSNEVADLLADYETRDGITFEVLGEQEEVMEAVNVLILAMGLAVLLIYMVMASQFQSLTYPLIIMFTIPLAFTGGFLILWLTGMTVSVVAIIGLIILVGVVVNNGIVLVDYTNQLRETGLGVKEALVEAGKTRMRPIVMTALTTILALSTMALGIGEGAEMMQPMAVTTIGGLLYATVLTLLVVPMMYYLVTKYGRLIFGYGGGFIIILIAVPLITLGMLIPFILLLVIGLLTITYTFMRGRKGSELVE
jgi:HAE1 family hydrophobic/amphiphilic exporter-1